MSKVIHAGNVVLFGFGLLLAGMSWLVYKSVHQQIELVSTDYYADEVKFQDVINARNNMKQLSDPVSFKVVDRKISIHIPQNLQAFTQAEINLYSPSSLINDEHYQVRNTNKAWIELETKAKKHLTYNIRLSMECQGEKFIADTTLQFK